jgi:Tfp pilus assembly protein PilO
MISSKRLIPFGVLAIALLAGTFVLVIAPANRRRDALQADCERKQAALARFNEDSAASTSVNLKIADVRHRIARLESKLPPARKMNDVVEDVWQLAEANSLQARTLKTTAGKRIGSYWAQEMDFSLVGPYAAFYQFVLQLEQSPAAVRIEKMTFNRIGGRDGDLQVEMTLGVLFQAEAAVAPASLANVLIDQR